MKLQINSEGFLLLSRFEPLPTASVCLSFPKQHCHLVAPLIYFPGKFWVTGLELPQEIQPLEFPPIVASASPGERGPAVNNYNYGFQTSLSFYGTSSPLASQRRKAKLEQRNVKKKCHFHQTFLIALLTQPSSRMLSRSGWDYLWLFLQHLPCTTETFWVVGNYTGL